MQGLSLRLVHAETCARRVAHVYRQYVLRILALDEGVFIAVMMVA